MWRRIARERKPTVIYDTSEITEGKKHTGDRGGKQK